MKTKRYYRKVCPRPGQSLKKIQRYRGRISLVVLGTAHERKWTKTKRPQVRPRPGQPLKSYCIVDNNVTDGVDKKDLAGVDAVAGHQLPDEDLVGARLAVEDLEAERQVVADLGRGDVVAVPVGKTGLR